MHHRFSASNLSAHSLQPFSPSSLSRSGKLGSLEGVFWWGEVGSVNSRLRDEGVKSQVGQVTVYAMNEFLALGTSRSLILIFDLAQNFKFVLGEPSKAFQYGSVTSIAISYDQKHVLAGYTSGYVIHWSLSTRTPTQIIPPSAKGHAPQTSIIHTAFIGTHRFTFVTGDTLGNVFLHVISRKWSMGLVQTVSTARIHGNVPNSSISSSGKGKGKMIDANVVLPTTLFALAALPSVPIIVSQSQRGNTNTNSNTATHIADQLGLIAISTPYKFALIQTKNKPRIVYKHHWQPPVSAFNTNDENTKFGNVGGLVSMSCMDWFRYPVLQGQSGSGSGSDDSNVKDPLLAVSGGREVFVVRVGSFIPTPSSRKTMKSKDKDKEKLDVELLGCAVLNDIVVGLAWLNDHILLVLTSCEELVILHTDSMEEIERVSIPTNVKINTHDYFSEIVATKLGIHPPMMSYSNALHVRKGKMVLLGQDALYLGVPLSWRERIVAFLPNGNSSTSPSASASPLSPATASIPLSHEQIMSMYAAYQMALELGLEFYKGEMPCLATGLPRDTSAREMMLRDEILSVLETCLKRVIAALGVMTEDENDNRSEDTMRVYTDLARLSFDTCLAIGGEKALYTTIFTVFQSANLESVFLETLEHGLLSSGLVNQFVPLRLVKDFVAYFASKGWFERLECVIVCLSLRSLFFPVRRAARNIKYPRQQRRGLLFRRGARTDVTEVGNDTEHGNDLQQQQEEEDATSLMMDLLNICRTQGLWNGLVWVCQEMREWTDVVVDLLACVHRLEFSRSVVLSNSDMMADVDDNEELAVLKAEFVQIQSDHERRILNQGANIVYTYLANLLTDRSYPHGTSITDTEEASTIKRRIWKFLLEPKWASGYYRSEGSCWTRFGCGSYPYLRLLMRYNMTEFLDMMAIVFEHDSLNHGDMILLPDGSLPMEGMKMALDEVDPKNPYKQALMALDGGVEVSRQNLLEIMLNIVTTSNTSSTPDNQNGFCVFSEDDIMLFYCFLMRSCAKYSNFVKFDDLFLRDVMLSVTKPRTPPNPQTRHARQSAVQALLTIYDPLFTERDAEELPILFEQAQFYRVCEVWYRSLGKYDRILPCFLNDDERSFEVFDVMAGLLSMETLSPDHRETIRQQIHQHIFKLLEIHSEQTARFMEAFFPMDHGEIVERIQSVPEALYGYLQGLLEPRDQDRWAMPNGSNGGNGVASRRGSRILAGSRRGSQEGAATGASSSNGNSVIQDEYLLPTLQETYIGLMCRFDPTDVVGYLNRAKEESSKILFSFDKVLDTCRNHDVMDAAVWVMEMMGDFEGASKILLGNLTDLLHQARDMERQFQSSMSKQDVRQWRNEWRHVLSQISASTKSTVEFCHRNTSRVSKTDRGAVLWFPLLDVFLVMLKELDLVKKDETTSTSASPSRSRPVSPSKEYQSQNAKIATSTAPLTTLVTTLQNLSEDIINTMVLHIPLPTILRKIFQERPSASLGSYRHMINNMLDVYTTEQQILGFANEIISKDVHEMQVKIVQGRKQGMRPKRRYCGVCKLVLDTKVMIRDDDEDSDENERDHEHEHEDSTTPMLRVFRCGHAYHETCYSYAVSALNHELGSVVSALSGSFASLNNIHDSITQLGMIHTDSVKEAFSVLDSCVVCACVNGAYGNQVQKRAVGVLDRLGRRAVAKGSSENDGGVDVEQENNKKGKQVVRGDGRLGERLDAIDRYLALESATYSVVSISFIWELFFSQ